MKRYDCPISKFRPILFFRHVTEHLIKLNKIRIYAFHQIWFWTGFTGNCFTCNNSLCAHFPLMLKIKYENKTCYSSRTQLLSRWIWKEQDLVWSYLILSWYCVHTLSIKKGFPKAPFVNIFKGFMTKQGSNFENFELAMILACDFNS